MKRRLILTAAAVPACTAALLLTVERSPAGVPFIEPSAIARAQCGRAPDALSQRRALFVSAAKAYAGPATGSGQGALPDTVPGFHYDAGTDVAEAQAWFDRGLADLFNFHHGAAVNAFRQAQAADPECALCYWGEALALGPNINAPMNPADMPAAFEATLAAQARMADASPQARALIEALSRRYTDDVEAERAPLDAAFADAMDEAARAFPQDDFIQVLAAEANMDTQPWDYWAVAGREPHGRTARTIELLETVLDRAPQYAPAIHLYIHITEASEDPYRSLPYADRLAELAPGLGHLIHMPSHAYFRVGRYEDSLERNIDAVAADEELIGRGEASEFYEYGYYTHNVHFALTSSQMGGDGETALRMAEKLDAKLPIEMAVAAPWVQPIKAAPYYALVQFGKPDDILALPDPGDDLPFLKAAWHYARGEAFARSRQPDRALAEAAEIEKLETEADFADLIGGGVPAPEVLAISRLTIKGRAAAMEGDLQTAIAAMEEATALQEAMPYMEPPWWYYPSRQTLAAYLLADGQTERAEQLFIETLAQSPNNAWVLFGLSEVYATEGDRASRRYARRLFDKAWLGNRRNAPELLEL
jgi:tetratricopeptide (TPR) repeat protein